MTKSKSNRSAGVATQSATLPDAGLIRLREAAMSNRRMAFNNLLHHITVERLKLAYEGLAKAAAPGVDGEDWASYGIDLDARLVRLHSALHTGRYRARPVRRQWIPKADGRQRPLGIACVEDKVVQQALMSVLTVIYEVDFLGFSYGFRPGRSQHDALDAVYMAVTTQKVNWLLEADIEACFDRIEHSKLMAVLRERIADERVLRIIEGTLRAGVIDEGTWHASAIGVPQGAVISPLLANVFLHAAIDRWVHGWRHVRARGQVCMVRYADDFVVGCRYRSDGELLRVQLAARLARFGLTLHPEKTRLLEFGRFAISNRRERGLGKPASFGFLGFTHRCVYRSDGQFALQRRTISKRLRAFLHEVKRQLRVRWAQTPREQGEWLGSVVRGYMQYHGVPGNRIALETVRREVNRMWLRALRRRSQKHDLHWARFTRWVKRWIPSTRIVHPYPNQRFAL